MGWVLFMTTFPSNREATARIKSKSKLTRDEPPSLFCQRSLRMSSYSISSSHECAFTLDAALF